MLTTNPPQLNNRLHDTENYLPCQLNMKELIYTAAALLLVKSVASAPTDSASICVSHGQHQLVSGLQFAVALVTEIVCLVRSSY